MSNSNNWRIPQTADDWMRSQEKRIMREERRASPLSAADLLGPGMSSHAVELMDWDAEEATFNGFFFSREGALNSPDGDKAWVGQVIARDDLTGFQHVWQGQPPVDDADLPPDGEPEVPPADPSVAPDPGTPDVPPNPGDPDAPAAKIKSYVRYFSPSEGGDPIFTEWVPAGSGGGGALDDLTDVTIYDDHLVAGSIIMYDPLWGGGLGQWVSHPFVPGLQDVAQDVQQALDDAAAALNLAEASVQVFRQPDEPVPGVSGVPNPIPDGSIWFDTDDGNHIRTWDGTAWVEIAGFDTAALEAEIAAAQATADQATLDAAAAIEASDVPGGATLQTDTSVSPNRTGIKFNSAGIVAYNPTTHVPTFTLTAATGAIAMTGPILTGGDITGAIVTGALVQSSAAATTGIKFTSTGLVGYDPGGSIVFNLLAATVGPNPAGTLILTGAVLAGGDISGATVTGGTVQSDASQSPNQTGIKFNNNGLAAYDAGHVPTFVITASTGAVVMKGSILSGSTITGTDITGSAIRGGVVSTSTSTTLLNLTTNHAERAQLRDDGNAGTLEFWTGNGSFASPGKVNAFVDTNTDDGATRARVRMQPPTGGSNIPYIELASLPSGSGVYAEYVKLRASTIIMRATDRTEVYGGLYLSGGDLETAAGVGALIQGSVTISGNLVAGSFSAFKSGNDNIAGFAAAAGPSGPLSKSLSWASMGATPKVMVALRVSNPQNWAISYTSASATGVTIHISRIGGTTTNADFAWVATTAT